MAIVELQSSGKSCVLPNQRFVIKSPQGTISDSFAVMTFVLEINGDMKIYLLCTSAKILERERSISPYILMGNCLVISHTC